MRLSPKLKAAAFWSTLWHIRKLGDPPLAVILRTAAMPPIKRRGHSAQRLYEVVVLVGFVTGADRDGDLFHPSFWVDSKQNLRDRT